MTHQPIESLEALIARSQATEAFKQAARNLQAGVPDDRITFNAGTPPVKALRVICKLLEQHSDVAIDRVHLDGRSGCSDYSGQLTMEPGPVTIAFHWDCRWKADQMGWRDGLGFPDQIRAAREFGYQCFAQFEAV